MSSPRFPSLYQINTRVWLTERSRTLQRRATLDDIPDAELDRLAACGFDWIWLLSVWQTGPEAQQVSRSNPEWRREFERTLPDLSDDDIAGSGFAITAYAVHRDLGGDAALARLRERLRRRGFKLMLDFVPNHMGLGHPWLESHADYFVQGTDADLTREPQNYIRVRRRGDERVFAYGRDPYFSGWPDTLQLDYSNPATQQAMIGELTKIAGQCDGVRCDMAMLVLPDIFERTWGRRAPHFWPAAIQAVRESAPGFRLMAEVYWDLEWSLQQLGFDNTYDKRLYDRLHARQARPVREHFLAGMDFQEKLARFLENHDEPRAAATFPPGVHEAAAVITSFCPGLRFFHQGQLEGRTIRISPHLIRAPHEPVNQHIADFYERLLETLCETMYRDGFWRLLDCTPAWEANWTHDNFVAFSWEDGAEARTLVAVNYAETPSQCFVRLPFTDLAETQWRFTDCFSADDYVRNGRDLHDRGLYLDMRPWQAAVYVLRPE
ncbi:MAG: hypothetical protein KF861_06470 [Planctomycetaceae bacterium]|nr:hypothetical protein [Planctomycetaceae bacterium]